MPPPVPTTKPPEIPPSNQATPTKSSHPNDSGSPPTQPTGSLRHGHWSIFKSATIQQSCHLICDITEVFFILLLMK